MPKKSLESTHCDNLDGTGEFIFGRYCTRCAKFDNERFSRNRYQAIFLACSLMQRHHKTLYQLCEGDLVMALVFCEIWQYNVGRYFARVGPGNAHEVLSDGDARINLLPACNSYSISQALGAPAETVRRKVQKLLELGWITRNGNGELVASKAIDDLLFSPDMREFMRAFVSTSRHVLALVDGEEQIPECFQALSEQ